VGIKNAHNFQILAALCSIISQFDLRRCGEERMNRVEMNDSGGSLNINSLKQQISISFRGKDHRDFE
jgi:hypothetical protein